MKVRKSIIGFISVLIVGLVWFCNQEFEIIPLNLSIGNNDADIKVMTWNIHSLGHDYDSRKTARMILKENADIVILNEYCDSTAHVTDSILLGSYHFSIGKRTGKCQDILYSKFPLKDFIDVTGDSIHGLLHRCVVEVPFTVNHSFKQGKQVLKYRNVRLVYCHLASNNSDSVNIEDITAENSESGWKKYWNRYHTMQEKRSKEINVIASQLDTIPQLPTIICGDMNDFSYSWIFEPLYSRGFKDVWWEKGRGYGSTWKYGWFRLRIDHFFSNNLLEPVFIKAGDRGNLSDHNPLLAYFKLVN